MAKLIIKNGVAVANNSGAMEQKPFKNGRKSKSHTSRLRNLLFIAVIVGALISSCATTEKSFSVKTLDITHGGVIQKPVIVDLTVGQTKVTGTAEGPPSQVAALKNEAVKDALTKAGNADVMVEPNFTISKLSRVDKTVTSVEVTGFPGTYKNFRTIEENDSTWLQNMDGINQAKIYDPTQKQEATSEKSGSKNRIWYIGGGIVIVIIALLL
jgi:hypothetical protein